MSFTISKSGEQKVYKAFTHVLADIPNGGTIATEYLTQPVLPEGTPVGYDAISGLYKVIKVAILAADAANDATTYTVKKGHNFKVGDFIMLKTGGKSYAISAIATNGSNSAYDDITVGTSLGIAGTAGDAILQAKQAGASGSAFPLEIVGLTGHTYDVIPNLFVQIVTIGQIRKSKIVDFGSYVKAALPLINVLNI